MHRYSLLLRKLSNNRFLSWFQKEISDFEGLKIQLIVAIACITGSVSIGLGFAKEWNVAGWQFWSWIACVIVLAIA